MGQQEKNRLDRGKKIWYFASKIILTYKEKKNVVMIKKKLLKFEADVENLEQKRF